MNIHQKKVSDAPNLTFALVATFKVKLPNKANAQKTTGKRDISGSTNANRVSGDTIEPFLMKYLV